MGKQGIRHICKGKRKPAFVQKYRSCNSGRSVVWHSTIWILGSYWEKIIANFRDFFFFIFASNNMIVFLIPRNFLKIQNFSIEMLRDPLWHSCYIYCNEEKRKQKTLTDSQKAVCVFCNMETLFFLYLYHVSIFRAGRPFFTNHFYLCALLSH